MCADVHTAWYVMLPGRKMQHSLLTCPVWRSDEMDVSQACTSLEVDVVVLDLSSRLGFQLRPGLLSAAVARGLCFEILYAPALRDETSRRNLFSNAAGMS